VSGLHDFVWLWECRDCKKLYPESGVGLMTVKNASGVETFVCSCGGVVDLVKVELLQTRGSFADEEKASKVKRVKKLTNVTPKS